MNDQQIEELKLYHQKAIKNLEVQRLLNEILPEGEAKNQVVTNTVKEYHVIIENHSDTLFHIVNAQ